MRTIPFVYWTVLCFAAGWYTAKSDSAGELRQLARDAYDELVDYTIERAAAHRRRAGLTEARAM